MDVGHLDLPPGKVFVVKNIVPQGSQDGLFFLHNYMDSIVYYKDKLSFQ